MLRWNARQLTPKYRPEKQGLPPGFPFGLDEHNGSDYYRAMNRATDIRKLIRQRPLIFDGAMGTMIYQRGIFLNACYDELNLTQAGLIESIHTDYVDAGADVIETNTFGANRIKLTPYGLADKVCEINAAAVRIALTAADDRAIVMGSIGPCFGDDHNPSPDELEAMDRAMIEQIEALVAAGVHGLSLETFHDIELLIRVARLAAATGLPVLASFTMGPRWDAEQAPGPEVEAALRLEAEQAIDCVGLNCGCGPADLFHPLRHVLTAVSKPVIVMPNAGGPREVGGRMLYLNSPEYFTEFSKRYIELGARGVGGCCGTTPAHIRMAARAIKTLSGVKQHIEVRRAPASEGQSGGMPAVPFAEKSPFAAKLARGDKVTSVEILPPSNSAGLEGFIEKCRLCEQAGVDAINLPDGPRASARLSVIATAFAMQKSLAIEPIPHYCCRDRNLIGMQSDLLGGCALGLKTWLFITGDPPKLGNYPDATGVFDLDAIGLARLADNLNHGFDAAGQPLKQATAMVIGVGANPLAVEMEREISRFFQKIDAGAEYAITQPVFEVEALLRFIERTSRHHRSIPIIAGIFPLLSFKNAEFMNEHVPGVVVPDAILERMSRCKTREDGYKTGLEIARETCERLAQEVAGIQISAPLGKIDIALAVLA